MRKLTEQVDIQFDQDWSKLISVLEHSINLVETKSSKITKEYKFTEYGYHYEIGNSGTVSHITNGSSYWYSLNGPLAEQMLPWLPMFLKDVAEIKPTFITINKLVGDGLEHVDHDSQQTGFNYFLKTTNSITYCRDEDVVESYPSVENTGWIMNIQQPHRIDNTDVRIWFNLRFGANFEQCRQFFSTRSLRYG